MSYWDWEPSGMDYWHYNNHKLGASYVGVTVSQNGKALIVIGYYRDFTIEFDSAPEAMREIERALS